MDHLQSEIANIVKQEELENIQIKQRIIAEQKKLKEQKDKQKRVVNNEFRRKYAETQEEKSERVAKERAEKPKAPPRSGGGFNPEGALDTGHVVKLLEEKRQGMSNMMLPADIMVVVKLH